MTENSKSKLPSIKPLLNLAWLIVAAGCTFVIANKATEQGYLVWQPHKTVEQKPECLNLNTKNGIMWVAHEGEPFMLVSMIDVDSLPVREETKK